MPYKSEKIKIAGSQFDRRRKLTEDQKEYIRWLHEEEQLSQRTLAAKFGVSRRLITFILNPEKERRSRENFKKRKSMGMYRPTKEEWAETMRNHRHYKQHLYTEGKIQEQQQKEESHEQQKENNEETYSKGSSQQGLDADISVGSHYQRRKD